MIKKSVSRMRKAIVETAGDMRAADVMTQSAYGKITMRDRSDRSPGRAAQLSPMDIRALREASNMSQAVFASHLNVTVGHISKLERGAITATGPALVLLNVIKSKGIDVLTP